MPLRTRVGERADAEGAVARADGHCEREPLEGGVGDLRAVHFLVEEVAPPPHRLRDEDIEDDTVGNAQKVDLLDEADDEPCENTAHHAAENAQSPVADTLPREPAGDVHAVRDAVVEPRADERRGNTDNEERQDEVVVDVAPPHEERRKVGRKDHARHDADGVEVDLKAEYDDAALIDAEERTVACE